MQADVRSRALAYLAAITLGSRPAPAAAVALSANQCATASDVAAPGAMSSGVSSTGTASRAAGLAWLLAAVAEGAE